VVIDYYDAIRAIYAQRRLAASGVRAVYIPYLPVAPEGGDADATHLVVHRIKVDDTDAERTRAFLAEYYFMNPDGW
jgi:hypothetical protein